ncbi:MAG: NAD(P)-dependent oxidoreductase, partial [Actinomycetota bacterium]|nr:NAD(P)-dependent oxidoreductase [Actinomycetota bacterium]
LYGPGSIYAADGSFSDQVRAGKVPLVGGGTATFSFIHAQDAATAIVAALDKPQARAFNIVDDDPAPMRDWLPVYAEALGAKPPRRVPLWLARLVAGEQVARGAVELRGASNAKAKRELGWQPAHPSWRQGFSAALAS